LWIERIMRINRGVADTTIHAPPPNFVITTTPSTTAVTVAPTPLTTVLLCHPGSRVWRQCTTMPA
jgi:hypothetical protein